MLSLEYKPFLNEGVDVYYDDNNLVTFVFLSTRKRIQVSAKKHLIKVLSYFDGNNTVEDILKAESVEREELHYFIQYLESKNILIDMKWFLKIPFDTNYKEKVKKQLFFLMDMLSSCDDVYKIQNKIKIHRRNALIPIFISITFNISNNTIFMYTDAGRLCRPLFYVDNNHLAKNLLYKLKLHLYLCH